MEAVGKQRLVEAEGISTMKSALDMVYFKATRWLGRLSLTVANLAQISPLG